MRWLNRRDFESNMTEELRFHIEQYTDELIRSGISPDEAARRARIEFGSINSVTDGCREARGLLLFHELLRELRYALRLLRKTPGFTLTALLTLALCLGANLAVFAVIDSILLRPLPFPESGRLVSLFNTYPKAGVERDGSSITNYYERRGRIPAFASLSIYRFGTATVGEAGSTEREQTTQISPEFFATLRVSPAMGRAFSEAETTYQTNSVALLTDTYWRQRYNSDAGIIGKQIRVDGVARTIVGVLPAGFRFLSSKASVYFPLASGPNERTVLNRHSGGNVTQMIARLRAGATLQQAQSQIDAQNSALEFDDPQARMMADAGFRTLVIPLHADHVAGVRPTLLLLQAGVLALLVIGAVNLVNLLLIRARSRVKELAMRQHLGASRSHVVSETFVETLLLTFLGGVLGVGVGAAGIRLLNLLGTDRLPLGSTIILDTPLILVALAATLLVGIVLAAPIAWFNVKGHLANALQSITRGGTGSHAAQRLRHGFIVAQIALAFILLAGAGLPGLSLKRAMAAAPGFRPGHVLTGQISLPFKTYLDAMARVAFADKFLRAIAEQPGVISAGVASNIPLSGNSGKSAATVKGREKRAGESPGAHYSYWVGGDYLGSLGLPLRKGRFLNAGGRQRVCVVDEDFARYYFPRGGAVGQLLFLGSEEGNASEAFTIVGVVGNVRQAGLTDDAAQGAVYYESTATAKARIRGIPLASH